MSVENELSLLKEKADILGIEYPKNIGAAKLQLKIDEANTASKANRESKAQVKANKSGLPKGVKLTDQQIRIAQAREPIKVKIANMNSDNSGATTVVATVVNMFMSLSRVVPLDMTIALERCLVEQIEARTYSGGVPELDKNGEPTGNMKTVEKPEYAVARL